MSVNLHRIDICLWMQVIEYEYDSRKVLNLSTFVLISLDEIESI